MKLTVMVNLKVPKFATCDYCMKNQDSIIYLRGLQNHYLSLFSVIAIASLFIVQLNVNCNDSIAVRTLLHILDWA